MTWERQPLSGEAMAARRAMARQPLTRMATLLVVALALVATACGAEEPVGATASSETTTTATAPSTTVPASTTTTVTMVALTQAEVAAVAADNIVSAAVPPLGDAVFIARIETITDSNADRLAHSWRAGCPVGLQGLRLLTLSHWNFAGDAATGELVVAAGAAQDIVGVFEALFDARFPIERMELVDAYAGDDDLSMAANNTSAFNCREVAWKPGVWSNHAFGTAIDVNPLVNPYVSTSLTLPPEGAAFVDRTSPTVGGLYPGDMAIAAFADIGWVWGGTWSSAKDWQHFSASGG
jgi:hypothetical protein